MSKRISEMKTAFDYASLFYILYGKTQNPVFLNLAESFRELNKKGIDEAIKRIHELTQLQEYKKK